MWCWYSAERCWFSCRRCSSLPAAASPAPSLPASPSATLCELASRPISSLPALPGSAACTWEPAPACLGPCGRGWSQQWLACSWEAVASARASSVADSSHTGPPWSLHAAVEGPDARCWSLCTPLVLAWTSCLQGLWPGSTGAPTTLLQSCPSPSSAWNLPGENHVCSELQYCERIDGNAIHGVNSDAWVAMTSSRQP